VKTRRLSRDAVHPGLSRLVGTVPSGRTRATGDSPQKRGQSQRDAVHGGLAVRAVATAAPAVESERFGSSPLLAEICDVVRRNIDRTRRHLHRLLLRNDNDYGLDAAIAYEPSDLVGGDYIDAVPMPDGRTLFLVADVCGNGQRAAPLSIEVHAMVHAVAHAGVSLTELVAGINEYVWEYSAADSFVTMACAMIDPHRPWQVEYLCAGHPSPLVVGPGGSLRRLEAARPRPGLRAPEGTDGNPLLGVLHAASFTARWAELLEYELLVFYSDGWETRDGDDGMQAFSNAVRSIYSASPDCTACDVAERLKTTLPTTHDGRDDRSLLLLRCINGRCAACARCRAALGTVPPAGRSPSAGEGPAFAVRPRAHGRGGTVPRIGDSPFSAGSW